MDRLSTVRRREAPLSDSRKPRRGSPGLVLVLTWVGVGDLLSSFLLGAYAGYGFAWFILVGAALRMYVASWIAKYYLVNPRRESPATALSRSSAIYAALFVVGGAVLSVLFGLYMLAALRDLSAYAIGTSSYWLILWAVLLFGISTSSKYGAIQTAFGWAAALFVLPPSSPPPGSSYLARSRHTSRRSGPSTTTPSTSPSARSAPWAGPSSTSPIRHF